MFYRKTVLDNGITVISEPMDSVRSVSLGIWFAVGSRDESPAEAGMSHFMEHMMFKGTDTRSARDISESFDRMGAEFNAGTSKEYTVYYARFLDQHVADVFEILADMVCHASLAEEECVKEREVVLEELARYEDHPEEQVGDVYEAALWPNHPVGLPIIGNRATVGGFGNTDAVAFRTKHFLTGNVVVAAAGNVDHDALVSLAERLLADLPTGSRTPRITGNESGQKPLVTVTKDTEQAHILLGMLSMDSHDERRFALQLLNDVIGGGMSSRLFQKIREQRGLAYAVQSYAGLYQDTGQFTVYVGTRPDNAANVIELVVAELNDIRMNSITAEELARTKDSHAGRLVLGFESTYNRMKRLGGAEMSGNEVLSTDDVLNRFNSVTADEVQALTAELLSAPRTLAVVSPLEASVFESLSL